MMSRTGIKARAGFSLIEVMFATAIFALATVFIFEIFLRSMDNINYCYNYFRIVPIIDDRVFRAQNEMTCFNALSEVPTEGVIRVGTRDVDWKLWYEPVEGMSDIYRISATARWNEGRKKVIISRVAYAVYDDKAKT